METFRLLPILILTLIILGCSEKDTMIPKEVIVSGKILNHAKYPDNYTVKILENDLVSSLGKYYTTYIREDGSFTIKFVKSFSSDISLIYGGTLTLFVSPGDSIFVEMDADEILSSKRENRYINNSLKFSGDNVQINREINEFLPFINSRNTFEAYTKEKTLLPEDYLMFLKSEKEIQTNYLDSLIGSNTFSNEFVNWAQAYIDYSFAERLFHYTWFYPFSNAKGVKEFRVIDIPESFYIAINDIPISNLNAIATSRYQKFLYEYFLVTTDYQSSLSKKIRDSKGKFVKSDLFQNEFDKYLQLIKRDYKGMAAEILISQKLFALMDSYERTDVFENLFPKYKKDLGDSFCIILEEKYIETKLFEENPNTINNLSKVEDDIEVISNDILKNITEKNEGKVIYVDFWATWCGPCLIEFEHSKNLANNFMGKNIEFVYLCVKSDSEKWEDKLQEYNLKGSHFLLNDSEFDILSQKFQILGIPHYVIIGKDGKIVDKNAPHPSSGEELIELIKKYLNKE